MQPVSLVRTSCDVLFLLHHSFPYAQFVRSLNLPAPFARIIDWYFNFFGYK